MTTAAGQGAGSDSTARGASLGLVGCGRWGRFILRDLNSLGCLVSVAEHAEANRGFAAANGAVAVVRELEALPEDLDGYLVSTPASTHAGVIERLLERGRPIFVEKPLSVDAGSARRLAGRAAGRLFVLDKWRYHPGVEALAALARSGELGPLQGLRMTRVQWGRPHRDVDAIWTLLPHDLAIAMEILGTLPPARAAAAEFEGGQPAGLLGILGTAPNVVLEVSARRPRNCRRVELICRDGVAVLDGAYANHVALYRDAAGAGAGRDAPEPERRELSTELPLLRELRAAVEFLAGGPAPRGSASDGATIVERIAELRAMAGLSPHGGVEPRQR